MTPATTSCAWDLIDPQLKASTNNCVVLSGKLDDPYTGATVEWQHGKGMSRNAQIDHVVSLSNAWQTGAAVGRRQAPQLRQRSRST